MANLVLYDPASSGHHPMYQRMAAMALLGLGHRVQLIAPGAAKVGAWVTERIPAAADRLETLDVPGDPAPLPASPVARLRATRGHWLRAAQAIESVSATRDFKPDLVFLLWLDDYIAPFLSGRAVDRLFPYPWSGLYFHPSHLCPQKKASASDAPGKLSWKRRVGRALVPRPIRLAIGAGFRWLYHPAKALRARHCVAVGMVDETLAERMLRDTGKPAVVFPDFTDTAAPDPDYELGREIRRRAVGRPIVGLIGENSWRKGLLTLLECVTLARREELFFVCAGRARLTPDWAAGQPLLRNPPENLLLHFERIPDEPQFNALIDACDVVFAAYRNFPHSSNLLTKAALFRKPVVVSEGYCMADRVRRWRLGRCVPEGDAIATLEALRELSADAARSAVFQTADFDGYARLHSLERLSKTLGDLLAAAGVANVGRSALELLEATRL